MSKNQKKNSSKKIIPSNQKFGTKTTEKKSDFYQKHKNTIWTIVVLVILTIFFIVNNTRDVPEEGPYPPNYNQQDTGGETRY
jgi:hypothetical protein